MEEIINLAEARKKLPELTDRASAGQSYVVSRRGRELAVLIGIDEYRRLRAIEEQQRSKDFDILLAPPTLEAISEQEANELAARIVHEQRLQYRAARK